MGIYSQNRILFNHLLLDEIDLDYPLNEALDNDQGRKVRFDLSHDTQSASHCARLKAVYRGTSTGGTSVPIFYGESLVTYDRVINGHIEFGGDGFSDPFFELLAAFATIHHKDCVNYLFNSGDPATEAAMSKLFKAFRRKYSDNAGFPNVKKLLAAVREYESFMGLPISTCKIPQKQLARRKV